MKPYYGTEHGKLYCGDCRDYPSEISDATAVVTDPPYGLGFMGKNWDHGVPGLEFWKLIMSSCLPGAPLMAFGGTRTVHRLVCAIEDAGWEIRDGIEYLHWIYGTGFPKSLDVSKAIDGAAGAEREKIPTGSTVKRIIPGADQNKTRSWIKDNGREYQPGKETASTQLATQWDGYGTALKPAHEPICLAMKPIEKNFAHNAQKHGVAGLNIDGGRIECEGKPLFVRGIDRDRQRSGYDTGGSNRTGKISTQGRWPSNIIHDGSPEVLKLFPQSNGQQGDVRGTEPSQTGESGIYGKYNRVPGPKRIEADTSAARFFYCAKASRAEREKGCLEFNNSHPTVKPLELIKYLLTLVTMPKRNLIYDPFLGSGTTVVACEILGLPWVACEKDEHSCEIAVARIKAAASQGKLSFEFKN